MVTHVIIAVTCLVSILCFTGTLNGNRLFFALGITGFFTFAG